MTSAKAARAKKASDEDILRLNAIGLKLETVGDLLGVHPATVSHRLRELGVKPAETRRAFMDDIYRNLSPRQQAWLADKVGPNCSIKSFMTDLLLEKFVNDRNDNNPSTDNEGDARHAA